MFHLKYRRTSPITEVDVDARTYEEAVAQVVAAAPEGEQVEVLSHEVEPLTTEPAKKK